MADQATTLTVELLHENALKTIRGYFRSLEDLWDDFDKDRFRAVRENHSSREQLRDSIRLMLEHSIEFAHRIRKGWLLDEYLKVNFGACLVPFGMSYRPIWSTLG